MGSALAIDTLKKYGTPQCDQWRKRIMRRHLSLQNALIRLYTETAEKQSHVEANRALSVAEDSLKLGHTGLYADCSDGQIVDYCNVKTRNLERDFTAHVKRFSLDVGLEWAVDQVQRAGLDFPLKDKDYGDKEKELSAMARVCCPKWWRRRLRTKAGRQLEQFLRSRGQVCRQRGVYVSSEGLHRRRNQVSRNNQLLLSLEAVSSEGDTVNLAECAAASVSNPENRRCELMTRIGGFEEVATTMGFVAGFFTLTSPSKYHAVHYSGRLNEKYNGSTAKDTQDYLCRTWAGIRALWHKENIRPFGFRVAEPHHDGTPHWHLLLFFAPDDVERAWQIFRKEALKVDGDEPGAKKIRADFKRIEPEKGTAAGYIAKYISKNIDSFGVETDYEAQAPADKAAERVVAWASLWGIRQFQQIGNTSVTIWRELRKVREKLPGIQPAKLEAIRAAADAGNWAEFVELMGGALVARKDLTIRALMVDAPENQYAEVVERIRGVVMRGARLAAHILITRTKSWTIRKVDTSAQGRSNDPP